MKNCLAFFVSLFLALALGGCSESKTNEESNTAPAPTSEEKKDLKEVSLLLDWYPNAVHSYIYTAIEKGYFAEEGVKVSIQFPTNPTDPLNLAAAGKVTLGLYYQPDVIMARVNENVPVKSVASIVRTPLNHIVFPEDSAIQSPKDLEGKKVGYPGIQLNEALLKTMVKHDGGDPAKVEMVDVGFELGTSIVAEQVDAVIGAFINHEVPVLKHKGFPTRNFNPVEYGVPAFSEIVIVTSDETWNKDQQAIKGFLRGAKKGFEFMKDNPDEALQILLANQDDANFPLVPEVEKESLDILLPMMETSTEAFGSQNKENWEEVAKWLETAGLLKADYNVNEMFIQE
ncbi:ABC transporter substrate-binding protein [Bacillus sp. Marseille-P3661]|uniref:ABC transporter substrate-binding protein n=1 Tax=Bacillus sp. Marseille-P3661 TaxID=1936234 RepID=UPI0027E419ED|nr:ABC transporter substrate-binding protein [Bacillus sp. Marseille-P3661]